MFQGFDHVRQLGDVCIGHVYREGGAGAKPHDAMIRERVLRMLEDHEAQSRVATASELVSQAMAQGEDAEAVQSLDVESRQVSR